MSRRTPPLVTALLVLGCALRLTGLGVHSLWYDEGATLHVARSQDLGAALALDRHPPLSFLAFRWWLAAVPDGDAWVRALPALVSCAALLAFAPLAGRWLPRRARPWAVGLFALAPFHVWYAQEARMYAFVELAAVAGLLGAGMLARGRARPWLGAVLLGGGCAAGLGAHYFGGLVAATAGAIAVQQWACSRRRQAAWLLGAAALGCAVWVPWLVTMVPRQLATPWAFQARVGVRDLAELPVRQVVVIGSALPSAAVYALGALVWAGVAGLALALWRTRGRRLADGWIALAVVTPPAAALAAGLLGPLSFQPNYLIAMSPGVALAIARGWRELSRRRRILESGPWLAVAVCLVGSLLLRRENLREDYRGAVAELRAAWRPGDAIVPVTGGAPGFNQATVRHYLRDRPDLLAAIAEPAAVIGAAEPPRRVHLVYRIRAYTAPTLARLERSYRRAHSGELRHWLQHIVLERAR